MVRLHVKRGDNSQFLYETTTNASVEKTTRNLTIIHNGRLKIERICAEMEQLAQYGAILSPAMQGLTKEEIEEKQLVDEWLQKFVLENAADFAVENGENKDPYGRRNNKVPRREMTKVLNKCVAEAKSIISSSSVAADECLTVEKIHDTLEMLKGAVATVYPQGLPYNDPVRQELENREVLTPAAAEDVLNFESVQLWWAGKELVPSKSLKDYVGNNEKTKIVVKLQKSGKGPPNREPRLSEEDRKLLMSQAYQREKELKALGDDDDDSYLNSRWADRQDLKKSFHNVRDISWKPK